MNSDLLEPEREDKYYIKYVATLNLKGKIKLVGTAARSQPLEPNQKEVSFDIYRAWYRRGLAHKILQCFKEDINDFFDRCRIMENGDYLVWAHKKLKNSIALSHNIPELWSAEKAEMHIKGLRA